MKINVLLFELSNRVWNELQSTSQISALLSQHGGCEIGLPKTSYRLQIRPYDAYSMFLTDQYSQDLSAINH